MKKLFLLAFVVLLALILINRQRVYLRDPIATVYRNNVKQPGVEVYFNYSNDVLLWKESDPGAYQILVQNWNKAPGTPSAPLTCIHWMACLANADHAALIPRLPPGKQSAEPSATMSSREVTFLDTDGTTMRVELR